MGSSDSGVLDEGMPRAVGELRVVARADDALRPVLWSRPRGASTTDDDEQPRDPTPTWRRAQIEAWLARPCPLRHDPWWLPVTLTRLEEFSVPASGGRRIGLYRGDLAALDSDDCVDLLVISAFPDDYLPTPGSVIGALHLRGLDVAALANRKAVDLRAFAGCWLSEDLTERAVGFSRLLCFEPIQRGTSTEAIGGIFRCLIPLQSEQMPLRCVAVPLVTAGQRHRYPGSC